MPRSKDEWVGKTDDSRPTIKCLDRLYKAAKGVCQQCNMPIGPKKWQADHKKRLEDGGANRESNLQVLCIPCHKAKTAKENSDGARGLRVRAKHIGIKRPKRGGFKAWRKFDGTLVWKNEK